MFDIGWTELLVIAVVMIIVVGPKDLPAMLRTMGRYAGKLRRTANEFKGQFEEAIRESELEEIRGEIEGLRNMDPRVQVKKSIAEAFDSETDTVGEDEANMLDEPEAKPAKRKAPRKRAAASSAKTTKKPARSRKPRQTATAAKTKSARSKTQG